MEFGSFLSAISGAVIGGVTAGYFALQATEKSFRHQKEQGIENEEKLITGLLQAIHDEIETVFDSYQDSMGSKLEALEPRHALTYYYPLVSDFFNVYNGNSFLLGRIPDNDLRKQIIKTYTLAKGMIDSYRMNNDLVTKWEFSEKLFEETQNEVHKNQTIAHYSGLVEYAETLKSSHKTLESEVENLLRALRKKGVLNEKNN